MELRDLQKLPVVKLREEALKHASIAGVYAMNKGQIIEALADPAWVPLAALDATTRMLMALVRGGGLRRGQHVMRALATFFARASQEDPIEPPHG